MSVVEERWRTAPRTTAPPPPRGRLFTLSDAFGHKGERSGPRCVASCRPFSSCDSRWGFGTLAGVTTGRAGAPVGGVGGVGGRKPTDLCQKGKVRIPNAVFPNGVLSAAVTNSR